ncbi:carboxypeptidase-like regulatory domain-containing protein [Bryocella elongata]
MAASPQMGTRDLIGTVRDRQHEPLNGAVVQLQIGETTNIASYITNPDGTFHFRHLDDETDYRLWATFRGHKSKVRKLSQFDSHRPKTMDFVFILH